MGWSVQSANSFHFPVAYLNPNVFIDTDDDVFTCYVFVFFFFFIHTTFINKLQRVKLKCDDFKSFPITFAMVNEHTLFKCTTRDLFLLFQFGATLYLHSTISQREILYFYHIKLQVTFQITICHVLPVQWKPCTLNVFDKLKVQVFFNALNVHNIIWRLGALCQNKTKDFCKVLCGGFGQSGGTELTKHWWQNKWLL